MTYVFVSRGKRSLSQMKYAFLYSSNALQTLREIYLSQPNIDAGGRCGFSKTFLFASLQVFAFELR